MGKNTLYLIPTPIGNERKNHVLPQHTIDISRSLKCFLVEKPQTSQRFLQWIEHPVPLHEILFRVLNKKTPDHEVFSFLKLLENQDVGILSEAGAPGVADPGARFVKIAHENGHRVVPLVGPSSILLAVMASGLNGQSFAFHGYLPIPERERIGKIKQLETESARIRQTQIVMETPHRNLQLFRQLLEHLRPSTNLCIACNITQPDEWICVQSIQKWKGVDSIEIEKKPALFLFDASA